MSRFILAVALALAVGHASAQPASGDDGLYKAFGEKAGIATLMEDFIRRLVADPRTQPFFKQANHVRVQSQLTDQLCMLSGGPCKYTGLDMKTAHARMPIGKGDFNALVEVLQDAMDAKGIPFRAQNRMLALLAPMHREIITRKPGGRAKFLTELLVGQFPGHVGMHAAGDRYAEPATPEFLDREPLHPDRGAALVLDGRGALSRHLRRVLRSNVIPLRFHRQLHATHRPRRNQAQKLLIQFDIPHVLDPPSRPLLYHLRDSTHAKPG